jgi:hypothetical protein
MKKMSATDLAQQLVNDIKTSNPDSFVCIEKQDIRDVTGRTQVKQPFMKQVTQELDNFGYKAEIIGGNRIRVETQGLPITPYSAIKGEN